MSAQTLFARIDARLTEPQRMFIRPMAALTVRFSGHGLAHLGKSVLAAIDPLINDAPEATRWRGVVVKRYAAAKPVSGNGFKPVRDALGKLKTLPNAAFQLYVKDGSTETLVPETFAMSLSLLKSWENSFATEGGLLSIAVPLEELESLVTLGDQLVATLNAEVAWAGPAVWLAPHCLFNSSSNELPDNAQWLIELFGNDPQLDAPHLHASRWPFTAKEVEPELFSGFIAPSWTMWASAKLAKKVSVFRSAVKAKTFTRYQLSERAPFEMTETIYAQWRAGWQALKPLWLKVTDERPSHTAKYFCERLSAPSYASLLKDWREVESARRARVEKGHALMAEIQKLAEAKSPKLLAAAHAARGQVDADSLCWYLYSALVEMIPAGQADAASGLVWLDFGEEHGVWKTVGNSTQLTMDAAALAAVSGDPARAFGLIKEAHPKPDRAQKNHFVRDQRFKPLRKLPEWKKLIS